MIFTFCCSSGHEFEVESENARVFTPTHCPVCGEPLDLGSLMEAREDAVSEESALNEFGPRTPRGP